MEKVVVTGYGVKCTNGYNKSHFRRSLESGNFDLSYFDSTLGKQIVVGRVPDDEFGEFARTRYSRVTKLALAAAKEAIAMANIPRNGSARVAVLVGTASGPSEDTVATFQASQDQNLRKYPLLGIGLMSFHTLGSAIVGEFGLDAKTFTLTTACNASSDALYLAKLLLSSKEADICLVGGAEAPLCEPMLFGFTKLDMAEADVRFEEAGIPFSGRDKFVMSEGAGVMVLERESVATARNAPVYGELLGVETNNDGLSAYVSDESGSKMKTVVGNVLKGLKPSYISSQALGLRQNDGIELAVREAVIGGDVPITSIKGVTGHPLGSTGILQAIAALLSIEYGFIPKTKSNQFTRALSIVTETVYQRVDTVCITSHGIGGNNSCILIGRAAEGRGIA